MRIIVERSALAKHEARIGRCEGVLVEGPSKKDASITAGRTRQNKLIHFASARPLRPGTFVAVRVVGAAPHHLRGEFVDITALPRHKTRIPVSAS